MPSSTELEQLLPSAHRRHLASLLSTAALLGPHEDRSRFARALARRVDALRAGGLTPDERRLVIEALQAEILPRRAACTTLATQPEGADALRLAWRAERVQDLVQRVEGWLSLLQDTLLPPAYGDAEAQVEYLTWTGDLKLMLHEHAPEGGHEVSAARSYEQAVELALNHLEPTHPLRLGVLLNDALCIYEHLKDQKKAAQLLQRALDMAVAQLDHLEGLSYEQTTAILKVMMDRLAAWKAEGAGA